jgi:low temperature requirement protein LtrA
LNPDAQLFGRIAVAGHAVTFLLALIAAFLPATGTVILWFFLPLIEYAWINVTYRHQKSAIPVNTQHIIERLGLLSLLVHGESIIALIAGVNIEDVREFVIEIVGFFLVFVLRQIYSTTHPAEPSKHAMRRSRFFQNLFFYGHILIGASLLGIGTAVKVILDQARFEKIGEKGIHLFFYSLAALLIVLNIVRLSHFRRAFLRSIWIIRGVSIIILLILPSLSKVASLNDLFSPVAMVFIGTTIMTIVSFVDRLEYDAPKEKQPSEFTSSNSVHFGDTVNL